jgi:hypothetical protein
MDAATWWRVLALTLCLFGMLCLALVFYYFYGICRLAESRFGRRTFSLLLLPCLLLLLACGLGVALAYPVPFGSGWFGICSAVAALLLCLVSARCYGAMMKR